MTVDEHARDAVSLGRLLIIGGGEYRCCGSGLLERFVELCGGSVARITLVTTATGMPDEVHAEYEQVFRKLGVEYTRELRLRGRGDADGDAATAVLRDSTGVFISGADQSRIRALVGSRTNDILRERENTAILVEGDHFEVLGTGVATVADAERATVVHPAGDCDPITLFDVRLHLMPAGCIFDIGQRKPSLGPAHSRY